MKYVVYSHTDYTDILSVHSDYLKFTETILLINTNDMELSYIYNKYSQVIFYNDALPYASRLLESIKQIDSDYILLIHDMDINLSVEHVFIKNLINYMSTNNVDRIDLQHQHEHLLLKEGAIDAINFTPILEEDFANHTIRLVKSNLYNVNPSIWKLSTLIDILSNFSGESYRTIENHQVDAYCCKFTMYKLYTNQVIHVGYYNSIPQFVFLHLTHGGGLMPESPMNCDIDILEQYRTILANYKFNRTIKKSMY